MRMTFAALTGTLAVALASFGTSWGAVESRAPATFIYALMVDMIGPAANSLWAAAAAPSLSEQDWARLKQITGRLSESARSVSFGGTTAGDLERSKSSVWTTWAAKFTVKTSLAANAVEDRDRHAFTAAADDLLTVCEGCHAAFPQTAR